MTERTQPTVALLGDGEDARRWARALRESATLRPYPDELPGGIDAVVLTRGTHDPFARAKEALSAGINVLFASPFLLSPWQASILDALSRREGRILRFIEPFQYGRGFRFLRRLLEGREPFWRPLYLRTLCIAAPEGSARIDELATQELAICDALLDGEPQHVTASAARRDEVGEVCAAFLAVQYADGPLVQCTISVAEAPGVRQLVAVMAERTVIMDELDPVTPLRVLGSDEGPAHDDLLHAATCGSEQDVPDPDVIVAEAQRFAGAVASDDISASNAERWTRVAGLWWAARQSMSFGGPVDVPSMPLRPGQTTPPPLRVIEGGGKTAGRARSRPRLTVVAN